MYTPLPTPSQTWKYIYLDYMSGLPFRNYGNNYVFVVIDRFSKMVTLTACKTSITAEDIVKILFKQV